MTHLGWEGMRVLQDHMSAALMEKAGWQQIDVKFSKTRRIQHDSKPAVTKTKTWRGTCATHALNKPSTCQLQEHEQNFWRFAQSCKSTFCPLRFLLGSIWNYVDLCKARINKECPTSEQVSTACLWVCNHNGQRGVNNMVWTKPNLWEASRVLFWWTVMNVDEQRTSPSMDIHGLYSADTSCRD